MTPEPGSMAQPMEGRGQSDSGNALGRDAAPGSILHVSGRFQTVRQQSLKLCEPLQTEDFGLQPMDDASPAKWHLAHTTWFFETFVLKPWLPDYSPFHPRFEFLFNSYYNGVGQPFPRAQRGFLSRPTVGEVMDYRAHVDQHMLRLLNDSASAVPQDQLIERLELGVNHEQQHQELLLTDLKYAFGLNPLYPAYQGGPLPGAEPAPMAYKTHSGGIVSIGAEAGFAFDNELPRHQVLLQPFRLGDRLVTNGEFLEFVRDGGYQTSQLWLSEGFSLVNERDWRAPLYWREQDGVWFEFRLDGLQPLDPHLPAVHVSAHEAFAYAAWRGARLPTEFEWEHAAAEVPCRGGFVESGCYHPNSDRPDPQETTAVRQLYGEVWQWTASSYAPYPGFKTLSGTLGEYNGKFMSSQLVLRGGSCASPSDHVRASYRNFFYPPDRWQFTGIRLASDID